MTDWSTTDWHHLTDADGRADTIPVLLAQLQPTGTDAVWSAIWARLYNQGTVYSASFAVLPELHALATQWTARDRVMPLALAGAIIASNDLAPGAQAQRQQHDAVLPALARLTNDTLEQAQLCDEPQTYIRLLQALASFEGHASVATALGALADGRYEVACPHCGVPLVLTLDNDSFTSAVHDFVSDSEDQLVPLAATSPSNLDGPSKRLHDRAATDGQHGLATAFTYLFGRATCPRCRTGFPVAQ